MDQRKLSARGKKVPGRAHAPTGDLIALGGAAKADADAKRAASPQPAAMRKEPIKRVGGASLLLSGPVPKKLALGPRFGDPEPSNTLIIPILDESGISVDAKELIPQIEIAMEANNTDQLDAILLGVVRQLRMTRARPDPLMCLSLMHLAKSTSTNAIFRSHTVVTGFCSLLQRDPSISVKSKGNTTVSVLACNLMMAAFADELNWPLEFVKVYVDDSMGERIWVDLQECRHFVQNILTGLGTRRVQRSAQLAAEAGAGDAGAAGSPMVVDDDDTKDSGNSDKDKTSAPEPDPDVPQRYERKRADVERYVTEVIKDQFNLFKDRRGQADSSWKHFIILLTAACGYAEVRTTAAPRLDQWLQNPKLTGKAQDLLMSICVNCEPGDGELIGFLCKLRSLKLKQHFGFYLNCLKELMSQYDANLQIVLTHAVYNELSTTRSSSNGQLFSTIFQNFPEKAAAMLGDIFHDFLTNKEDYLRALRVMYRETISRGMKVPLKFREFCLSLLSERNDPKLNALEPAFKERYVMAVADLVVFAMMVGVSAPVREAHASVLRREPKNIKALQELRDMVSDVQTQAIRWIHHVAPKYVDKIKQELMLHMLHKMLFLDPADNYTGKDNWPSEPDRSLILQILMEVPLKEDLLEMALVMGISSKLPIQKDVVTCAELLVRRAAVLGEGGLVLETASCVDLLMSLTGYRIPEDKSFPEGYTPASYAVISVFWRACIVVVILSGLKPNVVGKLCWKEYPTIRCLMEMVMTNSPTFPPLTVSTNQSELDAFLWKDQQIQNEEREQILEFESYLANSHITSTTSLLLPNLILLNPTGQARQPPAEVIKDLMIINSNLKVGIMLCRSRDPDFLKELIEKQGAQRSMPWLAELVEQSEGSLDVLPVQSLCEFLLHDSPEIPPLGASGTQEEKASQQQKQRKQQHLLRRLQRLVRDDEGNVQPMAQVLDYFMQRLNHHHAPTRAQAIKGLELVLSDTGEEGNKMEVDGDVEWKKFNWLLVHLPALPLFAHVKEQICKLLGSALREEMEPKLVSAYVVFLSQHAPGLSILTDVINDITFLLTDRPNVRKFVVPMKNRTQMQDHTLTAFISLYLAHLQTAITDSGSIPWCSDQDMVHINWNDNRSAILPNMVVQAMISLLTYGPPKGTSRYEELLDLWVRPNGETPHASLMDTQEEALLLPDILRLNMIRSNHPRLLQAALQELDVQQLILYVQFFGIPVENMSRLLAYLDNAVKLDPKAVEKALQDRAYVAHLVRVQQMRGATGGHVYLQVFGTPSPTDSQPGLDYLEEEPGPSEKQAAPQKWDFDYNNIAQILLKVFDPQSLNDQETINMFQEVLKTICTNKEVCMYIFEAFQMLLDTPDGQKVADTFVQIPSRACPLIKIIMSKWPCFQVDMVKMLGQVLSMTKGTTSLVVTVIQQYLKDFQREQEKKQAEGTRGQEVTEMVRRLQGQGKLEGELVVKGLQELSLQNGCELETLVEGYMEDTMRRGQTAEGARVACRVLLDSESGCAMSESAAALFLDWLELLDPEVVCSNEELQQQLLFAQKLVGTSGRAGGAMEADDKASVARHRPKLPHLLALLTHQSHWATLHRCLNKLLYRPSHATHDATAVLDFLWACHHIPKLWRGRDHKATPKGDPEDLFMFGLEQILSIVDYILQEAEASTRTDSQTAASSGEIAADQNGFPSTVRARMGLLETCICENPRTLKTVVEHLCQGLGHGGTQSGPHLALLQELYLHFPYILDWLPHSLNMASLQASKLSASKMDSITHHLLTLLGSAVAGKKASQTMEDANYALRKLAAHHPLLLLRQLPMIGAELRGKTDFTFPEMKHRNYLLLFTHVLGLMQLLQPHIFRPDISGLPEVLEAFFSLLQVHGKNQKSLASLIVKLVVFLQQYVHHDPQGAIPILQGKVELLSAISSSFPDLSELKSLLAGLTLPRQTHSQEALAREEGTSSSASAKTPTITASSAPMKAPSQWTVAQLAPFAKKMTKDSPTTVVLEVLTDLDDTSKRKLEILEYFESELMRLMSHPNEKCREKAFALVLRHLEFAPRRASGFVAVFLRCVEHEDPGVRKSALNNLTEFTLLCQDYAQEILPKAFAVNIRTAADKDSVIADTLMLLNLQEPKPRPSA